MTHRRTGENETKATRAGAAAAPAQDLFAGHDRRDDWLVGGGRMALEMKAMDWSKTPLGPMASWPQSLRTTVSLAQASNSPISLIWGTGHVQIYNDGYWPICGAKHPTSMGQDFRECWASAFPVIGEAYATAWSGKSAYLEKMRMFLDRYGFMEETWFTFSFSPITDESGDVGGLFHPVTEMTSQMLSERRTKTLRDLASRAGRAKTSEHAFAISAQVLAEADLDLPFVLVYLVEKEGRQARLVGQTGIRPGTAVSPKHVDLHAPDDQPWSISEVARTGVPLQIDDAAQRLAGMTVGPYPEIPKMAFALPITQPGSDKPAAVIVAGVSSRLPMTEPYRGFYDLVGAAVSTALANARAYEEERRKAEAFAEIDRAKTVFFSNVSHEFRTPLTLILGPVEDALAQPSKSLGPEEVASVHRSALRLLRLVNSMLDFARIEAGRLKLSFAQTDLSVLTADLASSFRSLIERAGLKLVVDCPAISEAVYVDSSQWEKIVLNLLSNAFKFTFKGEISVSLRSYRDHVRLAVRDTGTGIPSCELPRMFERFHRVEGAKGRSFEGTGIGLSLVQELVKLHGGSLQVSSVEGQGSTFEVSLPTGRVHLPAERIVDRPAAAAATTGAAPFLLEASQWIESGQEDRDVGCASLDVVPIALASKKTRGQEGARVLVADDNADMREYLARLLSKRWRVELAEDGRVALAKARHEPPDLVLSDVMMPRLDGIALLRELRAHPRTSHVPVVLLSARAGEEAVLEGLETGADDYLVKPFAARELLARVQTHLELARLRREWAGELERANKELEAFSYSVSHDLRAPLRAIDGFSEALLSEYSSKLDEQGRHYLDRVRSGTQRMAQLIDDLLSLSRVTRAPMCRERVDLTALARKLLLELAGRDPERRVKSMVSDDLVVQADPRLVAVLLENLLGNAWKFTSKQSLAQIEVGKEEREGDTVFFVRDNGAGFNMEYAKKLFTPFQRLHSGAEFPGTGIGLATVHRIVTRHGGRVWAEASPGHGATFFSTLGAQS